MTLRIQAVALAFSAALAYTFAQAAAPAPAPANDPNQAYEQLYGDEARKLTAKDIPAFAEKLLKNAGELRANPALAELLMVKATDLYFKSAAGDDRTELGEALIGRWASLGRSQLAANNSSQALNSLQQASKIAIANKSDKLPAITLKIKAVQARIEAERKLADLLGRLKAKPDDAVTAKEVVLLYILELDRPAEAAQYAGHTADESLKTCVPLAARNANDLQEASLAEVGAWYEGLAAKATPEGKAVAYGRAKGYFEKYLARHSAEDEHRLAAKKSLASVSKELEKLPGAALPAARKEIAVIVGSQPAATKPASAPADDPNQAYERVYGDEARKLMVKDFPAFAEKLVKGAAELAANPPLAELLMVKATDLYFRSAAGFDKSDLGETLVDRWASVGHSQLDANSPSQALNSLQQASRIAVANKSDKLPAITLKIKAAQARIEADKKLADLLAKLKDKPDDSALAKEVVLLYILELDRPAEAAQHVGQAADESLKACVPLAAKNANELREASLAEVGAWYEGLAAKATPEGKAVAYERAKTYFEKYLKKHSAEDEHRLAAKKSLASVSKELEKLSGAAVPAARKEITVALGKGVTMKMVLIPAGKFMMGSPAGEKDAPLERPQHQVKITKAFYMGATEVTQAQYQAVIGENPSMFKDPNNPVEMVSCEDADAFCKRLSQMTHTPFRLPTEAEWEYACRAGTTTKFSFGAGDTDSGDYAWHIHNSDKKTHPVALKKPNPWGLYDMHGNVWEWCSDRWAENYADAKDVDPQGPDSGGLRVRRGGCFDLDSRSCRSASRGRNGVDSRFNTIGFRVVAVPAD